jgi:hypothetical protein
MKTATCRGNALIIALIMIVAISGFVGVAYTTTEHSGRMADRSRDYAGSQAAAEGAVEYAFGMWKSQIAAANTPAAGLTLTAPTFPGQTMSGLLQVLPANEYGASTSAAGLPPAIATDVEGYRNWRGSTYNYLARAQMNLGNGHRVGVRRQFQYAVVPLFQTMYFFEHDFEIYKPATMIIGGLIHSNSTAVAHSPSRGISLTLAIIRKLQRRRAPPGRPNPVPRPQFTPRAKPARSARSPAWNRSGKLPPKR